MAYDTDTIYNALVEVVDLAIGARLNQQPLEGGGTISAIFKKRAVGQGEGQIYGLLPYCVVSGNARDRQGASVNSRDYNDVGDEVLTTIYDQSFTFLIVGGDAEGMACDLEAFICSDAAIELLCDSGMAISNTYGVRPTTTNLNSVPHDSAKLNVKVTTTGQLVQQVYEMSSVSGDLHVRYPNSEDDIISSPLDYP